jgi:hypothetical protein
VTRDAVPAATNGDGEAVLPRDSQRSGGVGGIEGLGDDRGPAIDQGVERPSRLVVLRGGRADDRSSELARERLDRRAAPVGQGGPLP